MTGDCTEEQTNVQDCLVHRKYVNTHLNLFFTREPTKERAKNVLPENVFFLVTICRSEGELTQKQRSDCLSSRDIFAHSLLLIQPERVIKQGNN